jgi:hypothetical protein
MDIGALLHKNLRHSAMTEMVTYRTEVLTLNAEKYTVQFKQQRDRECYALLATNEATQEKWECTYSQEVAEAFKHSSETEIEDKVYQILKDDLDRGMI